MFDRGPGDAVRRFLLARVAAWAANEWLKASR
jgi:hypothetical protein